MAFPLTHNNGDHISGTTNAQAVLNRLGVCLKPMKDETLVEWVSLTLAQGQDLVHLQNKDLPEEEVIDTMTDIFFRGFCMWEMAVGTGHTATQEEMESVLILQHSLNGMEAILEANDVFLEIAWKGIKSDG